MVKIELTNNLFNDTQIKQTFVGNINVPATQHNDTITIIDINDNEFIITVENGKMVIYKN